MKRWSYGIHIAVIVLVGAAFIFAAPAFGDEPAKTEKIGKSANSAETKMMNKTDKAPKAKTAGNGAEKAKVKAKSGVGTKGDDISLKKGGKTQGGE